MTTPTTEAAALHTAAREAFLYALPMTEIANVRDRLLGAGLPANRFFAQQGLATPDDRVVTTPNADTIYANAFIDLGRGPATLTLPPLGPRYASLALMDMFSNVFTVLGTRTTGQGGGSFTLVGPTDKAPSGAIRAPTPWVWAMARVLVNGPADASAALELLHGFGCEGAPVSPCASGARRDGPWQAWMRAAAALLAENSPPATDRRILAAMAPLGLDQPGFDPARFSAADAAEITAGVEEAKALTRFAGFGGRRIGGWLYPAANTGAFFQDYLTRARIAVSGLAALPTAEAMYLAAVSPDSHGPFAGEGPWRLRFPAEALPPVDGFWSLTMYAAEPDGGLFLARNPIDRYAIGDRTPGLVRGVDGGLDIWISRTDPGGARTANWLPAPTEGPFVPILRTYLPREDLVSQRYTPPPIEKL
jgi:hypothetical protein